MGKRLRKLRNIRLHHEGTTTLVLGFILFAALNVSVYYATKSCCPIASHVFFELTTIV